MAQPKFSIIIPTLNEAAGIARHLEYVLALPDVASDVEIIVVDGGSSDETTSIAGKYPVRVIPSKPGRSRQMNVGAEASRSEYLFFLHADSLPPQTFVRDVMQLIEFGAVGGCYRLAFDDPHPLLKSYAWFTRFDVQAFRFGDQGLFVPKHVFAAIGGFNECYIVMEDNDLVARLRRFYRNKEGGALTDFTILPYDMITSARRYRDNGIIKLQLVFAAIYVLHHAGIPHSELKRFFIEWIHGRPVA
ncbi:MAG: TIGR04283 family arsenosugar biosynthesis glycosyltransferase [Bacteroidetes bacterium]|nr:TIGR04283 family arsenosugar biosynthesis glycosyltransferase [Bacteroidota bacterium]MCH8525447.1 TIGR04283 family arsenosugar biosynthesis glycosyltransferase [Balneolales bacterium]